MPVRSIAARQRCRLLTLLAAIAAVGLAAASPAWALDCPAPQRLTRAGVLKETPTQITVASTLLASGDDANRIGVIVSDLRARYPGVENAEIVNYLMAAYCPILANLSGLGESEKQARMDRFVRQVAQTVY